jgi:two-component system response regulator CpxR
MRSNPQGKPSILCIEDDVDTCEFLAILLDDFHFEFTHSIDGAMSKLKSQKHDLYILDNWLPDGSGIDLCRRIKSDHPETPVVFTSGSSRRSEIADALNAGADKYMLKPCEPEILKEIVKDLIFRN